MLKCYSYDIVCQEIPEEISLAVNISCCPNRCPGCHSPWLWEDAGESMTEEFLEALIGKYKDAITCFCFMGGDAEPLEIERLAFWIKEKYPHVKTAWYSGNDRIAEGFDILSLDYVKIGPFRQELGGLKSPTTNQALYMIESDGNLKRIYL